MQEVELVETVDAYKCSYCNMVSLTRSSVVRHEKKFCRKSPVREACILCKNFVWVDAEISIGEEPEFVKPYCDKQDETLECNPNENIICVNFETKIIRVDPILTKFCIKYKK